MLVFNTRPKHMGLYIYIIPRELWKQRDIRMGFSSQSPILWLEQLDKSSHCQSLLWVSKGVTTVIIEGHTRSSDANLTKNSFTEGTTTTKLHQVAIKFIKYEPWKHLMKYLPKLHHAIIITMGYLCRVYFQPRRGHILSWMKIQNTEILLFTATTNSPNWKFWWLKGNVSYVMNDEWCQLQVIPS